MILAGVAILQGLQNAIFVVFVFGRAGYVFCNLGQAPHDYDPRIYVTFFFPFLRRGLFVVAVFCDGGGFPFSWDRGLSWGAEDFCQ